MLFCPFLPSFWSISLFLRTRTAYNVTWQCAKCCFVRSCLVSEALAVTLRMRTVHHVTWQCAKMLFCPFLPGFWSISCDLTHAHCAPCHVAMRQNAVLSVFLPGFLLVPDVTHAHVTAPGHQLTHPTRVRVKDPEINSYINRVKGIVSRDEYLFFEKSKQYFFNEHWWFFIKILR